MSDGHIAVAVATILFASFPLGTIAECTLSGALHTKWVV